MLQLAADGLGPLLEDIVFVGGCAAGLLITNLPADAARGELPVWLNAWKPSGVSLKVWDDRSYNDFAMMFWRTRSSKTSPSSSSSSTRWPGIHTVNRICYLITEVSHDWREI